MIKYSLFFHCLSSKPSNENVVKIQETYIYIFSIHKSRLITLHQIQIIEPLTNTNVVWVESLVFVISPLDSLSFIAGNNL